MPDKMQSRTDSLKMAEIFVPEDNIRKDYKNSLVDKDSGGMIESVREKGIIQPVIVLEGEWPGGLKYKLRAGFRRYTALKIVAGDRWANTDIPCIIFSGVSDSAGLEIAMIENDQRKDMSPLDRASAFKDYLEKNQCTQADLAARIGRTAGYVSQVLSVGGLPDNVKKSIKAGRIDFSSARVLAKLEEFPTALNKVFTKVEEDGLSGRALQLRVDEELSKEEARKKAKEKAEKQKEKAEKAKERAAKGEPAEPEDAEEAEEAPPPTLAEQLRDAKLKIKGVTDMRELLVEYATKFERAKTDENKLKYNFILEGIRLAAGVEIG